MGSRAQPQELRHMVLAVLWHVRSHSIKDQTRASCTGNWIPAHEVFLAVPVGSDQVPDQGLRLGPFSGSTEY